MKRSQPELSDSLEEHPSKSLDGFCCSQWASLARASTAPASTAFCASWQVMDSGEGKARFVVVSRERRGPRVGRGVGGAVDKIALGLVDSHVSAAACHFAGCDDDIRMFKAALRTIQHEKFVSMALAGRLNCRAVWPDGLYSLVLKKLSNAAEKSPCSWYRRCFHARVLEGRLPRTAANRTYHALIYLPKRASGRTFMAPSDNIRQSFAYEHHLIAT